MKFFDCDWNLIFRWLPLWEQLSLNARRQFLNPSSHAQAVLDAHWFRTCRRIPLRRSWMVQAPDRETAVRIQKVLGTPCTFVNDTLLEYRGAVVPPAERKASTGAGLFLGRADH